jgi:LysM repeat protein
MTHRKFSVPTALLTLALLLSACDLRYSQAPLATPTLIPTGLFASPDANALSIETVVAFGQETASAQTAQAGTPSTPATPTLPNGTVTTPQTQTGASLTPTVGFPVTVSATTPAPVTVIPGATTVTPNTPNVTVVVPTVGRPATYTLQSGEWPFCVARRFNVSPDELMSINGLVDSQIVTPGLVLKIPQTGNPFPTTRAWHTHPATFVVGTTADFTAYNTIFGVACYYGDVLPQAIAQANNLSLSATLTSGQQLTIP